jgi:hypothetical protein
MREYSSDYDTAPCLDYDCDQGQPTASMNLEPRVVQGGGGYTYQQNPDGSILVLDGPTGVGATVTSGGMWAAITAEIGAIESQSIVDASNTASNTEQETIPVEQTTLNAAAEVEQGPTLAEELMDAWVEHGQEEPEWIYAGGESCDSAPWWSADPDWDAINETPALGVDVSDDLVMPMSQFIWYGYGQRELGREEAVDAMRVISGEFQVGSFQGVNSAPSEEERKNSRANPNAGYWWFRGDGSQTWCGADWAGGEAFALNPMDWSNKLNAVSSFLSADAPGERPAFWNGDLGFSYVDREGYEPVSTQAQNLDLNHLPGGASCFATADAMLDQAGVDATRDGEIMNLVDSESYDEDGMIVGVEMNTERAREAMAYLDFETAIHPVFVGVTYKDRNGNSDDITDHWIVIDAKLGDGEYSFHDPGTTTTEQAGSENNVIVWDGEKLVATGAKEYIVSWVRPNAQTLPAWREHLSEAL